MSKRKAYRGPKYQSGVVGAGLVLARLSARHENGSPLKADQLTDLGAGYMLALTNLTHGNANEESWSCMVCSLNIGMALAESVFDHQHEEDFVEALEGAFRAKIRSAAPATSGLMATLYGPSNTPWLCMMSKCGWRTSGKSWRLWCWFASTSMRATCTRWRKPIAPALRQRYTEHLCFIPLSRGRLSRISAPASFRKNLAPLREGLFFALALWKLWCRIMPMRKQMPKQP